MILNSLNEYEELKHIRDLFNDSNEFERINAILYQYRLKNDMFEPGDKIVCVDAIGQRYLKLGKEYIVSTPDHPDKIYVDGYRRYSFLKKRFRHVEK